MSESLAIIGISCLFPKADDLQAYWRNIKNGVDAISPIPATHWNIADYYNADPKAPDQTYAQQGGFLSPVDFNPMDFGIAPKDVEATDTTQLLGMMAAKQALVDAGYGEKPFKKERTSVVLGVTGALELVIPLGARLGHPIWRRALKEAGVDETVANDVVDRISDSYVGWQENSFPGLLGNVAAGRIANRLDLGGTNCVVDAACASSMAALHMAAMELTSGRSDMVITGGIDTFNDIFMYMCFSKTPALSPTGNAKPFDRSCDGTILGEGLGMLVLKRLSDAEKDGDRIYAVIKGIGSASDGYGNAIYAPRAEGQKKALERAYAEAGVSPQSIDLVEAHGTGTKVGDATELKALTEVFRNSGGEGSWAALGSVKSQIGHTKASAGVAGLIKAALALSHKVLPPTIKVTQPVDEVAPGRSPFYVNTQKRPWLPRESHPRRAGVSAFGFGGTNFHCVLEEFGSQMDKPGWDGDVEIIALSSDSREGLRTQLSGLPDGASWPDVRTRAWQSRQDYKSDAQCRVLLPVTRGTALSTIRDAAAMMFDKHPEKSSWSLPNGVSFGSGKRRGKLGALFPGQGSQYVGMFRDLACQFPAMMEALIAANRIFASERCKKTEQRLSDYIYPQPVFNDEARKQQTEALKSTDIAQPALGAAGLGAMNVLAHFGIKPEAAAGHSYGELLALCGAGRFETESLHLLSNVRGRLMATRTGAGDRGAMLAVQASEEAVTRFVGESTQLVIANRNSPSQFVLAGAKEHIEEAADKLAKQSVRARVLQVAAAFHSEFVADACEPFAAALENVTFSSGHIPVYANSTAKTYPVGAKQARETLARQIIKPVDFMAQIETMYADGVTTFVEMGPGHVLSDLVQAILPGREVDAIALDASKGSRSGTFDLAVTLCRVAALGHNVDLARWENRPATPKKAANGKVSFTIPLTGANHRNPQKRRPAKAPAAVAPVNRPAAQPIVEAPKPAVSSEPALQAAQQGILTLQKLQEQTAQLHRQFLENQDSTRRTLEALLGQRRDLIQGTVPAERASYVPPVVKPMAAPVQPTPVPVLPKVEVRPNLKSEVSNTNSNNTAGIVLSVVAEKTGYPSEMLNLDMGLDSDLGIDSIKRVEIMAAIRTQLPTAPEIKPEHLGTLQTLKQIVDFLTPAASSAPVTSANLKSEISNLQSADTAQIVLSVVAEKTGYPSEMLNLDMGLDSDLGIDSIKRVEIMAAIRTQLPTAPEIKPEHLGTLQTLKQIVDFLTPAASSAPVTSANLKSEISNLQSADTAQIVLSVVAEKTGYPSEMLNLDMGLDSDLGIDSIKRVEIMAAIRTQLPTAPEIKPEHLGTLQTLKQIVDFLTPAASSVPVASANLKSEISNLQSADTAQIVLSVVAEKTGYPSEMLNLDMGLDSDLGIDSIKRVEIMAAIRTQLPTAPEIKPEHLGTLQTLKQIVDFLTSASSAAPSPVPNPQSEISNPQSAAPLIRQIVKPVLQSVDKLPIHALPPKSTIWITEDGSELAPAIEKVLQKKGYTTSRRTSAQLLQENSGEKPSALVILSPAKGCDDAALKEAFKLIQTTAPTIKKANGILITVSRLDGTFGFGSLNDQAQPISGGLAGLSKTARHEWPNVNCKALDLAPEFKTRETAEQIVEEMFHGGPVEVGFCGKDRFILQVNTVPQASSSGTPLLTDSDVVIVTGGARGITATTAIELAHAYRPKLVLLGRSRLIETEPEWLVGVRTESDIKKALLARSTNGDRSPKKIEAGYRDAMAQREIRECLRQLRAAGAVALYRTADVRNKTEVEAVLKEIRQQVGPIRGLIHGAGVLADRRIEDKTAEQFDLVYGTKVEGLRNLLAAVAGEDLKVLALFSSYTGRFGRTGQVDYAAANEVLNKMAQAESRRRPQCRVVAFNWGPWNGGMVSDGLRKIFAGEGVGLIEPKAGAEFFVREISSKGPVEVLVLGPLSEVPGGTPVRPSGEEPAAPVLHSSAFEREVSVKSVPCLQSHVLNGRAVLPTALMIEWLGHGAVHGNPGMAFHGLENFNVLKGLILEPNDSVMVSVLAEAGQMRDGLFRVPVQLVSQSGGRKIMHARAEALLAEVLPGRPASFDKLAASAANGHGTPASYTDGQLFHGKHFHGIESVESCTEKVMTALVKSAPAVKQWIQNPLRPGWMADPLVLDSSFQMMILWSWKHRQAASLPCAIKRFRQFVTSFPKNGSRVMIEITSAVTPLVSATLSFFDMQGNLLALVEGYECVIDKTLAEAFLKNSLV